MKVLIASNSIKHIANATSIAEAISEGLSRADSTMQIKLLPMADGGVYTLDILLAAMGGERIAVNTVDPLNRPIMGEYGITSDNEAVIELSNASGEDLLTEEERNPIMTSTYGTGIQIRDAIEKGCRHIYLALGGSATLDGGAGILAALGINLLDKNGEALPAGGGNLLLLDRFDAGSLMPAAEVLKFTLLSDVSIPLLGEEGASMKYAREKGIGPMEAMVLERCLSMFGERCESYAGKNLIHANGAGTAGGTAFGIMTFFNTTMISAAQFIMELMNGQEMIDWADLIITVDEKLDSRTAAGNTSGVIAEQAKLAGKNVVCIAGEIPYRGDHPEPMFDAVFTFQNQPVLSHDSKGHPMENIRNIAFEIGRLITMRA